MKNIIENLLNHGPVQYMRMLTGVSFMCIIAMTGMDSSAAAVVQRPTAARPTASRVQTASRMPSAVVAAINQAETTTTVPAETIAEPEPDNTPAPIVIEDKTEQFSASLSTANETINASEADTTLAEMIRRQRAALDANDATATATSSMQRALAAGKSACDTGLRTCMQSKCGTDFSKCSGDGDTAWGNKLDSCRRDVKCTGEEYRLYSAEIKADRDMNARLSAYNKILDCGNRYNDCIATQCGITYGKCLGKTAGDAAIAACASIASECTQQDNGLANRTMQVFATLRQTAEVQVKKDEQRLYALRDQMAAACKSLGAMFDERSLDCVYTVEFYAGNATTPYATKKAYAGSTFDCNQNWFGVDITTFKENAYRLTREQKSATSAMLGSGVGIAAGAITSGAIDRAIDRQKAERALKNAEKEQKENADDKSKTDKNQAQDEDKKSEDKETGKKENESKETESGPRPGADKLKSGCEAAGGTYTDNYCSNPKCGEGEIYDDWNGKCKKNDNMSLNDQENLCKIDGGIWSGGTCLCKNAGKWDSLTGTCTAAPKLELDDMSDVSLQSGKKNPLGLKTPSFGTSSSGSSGTPGLNSSSTSGIKQFGTYENFSNQLNSITKTTPSLSSGNTNSSTPSLSSRNTTTSTPSLATRNVLTRK